MGQKDLLGKGMAIHSSVLPMDRGAWWAIVHGGHKESDTTEQLTLTLQGHMEYLKVTFQDDLGVDKFFAILEIKRCNFLSLLLKNSTR